MATNSCVNEILMEESNCRYQMRTDSGRTHFHTHQEPDACCEVKIIGLWHQQSATEAFHPERFHQQHRPLCIFQRLLQLTEFPCGAAPCSQPGAQWNFSGKGVCRQEKDRRGRDFEEVSVWHWIIRSIQARICGRSKKV